LEIRKPKKSDGVPKQKRSGTLLHEIMETFSRPYGSKFIKYINKSIEESGYWDSSLSEQMIILSNILFDSVDDCNQLIDLLKRSNSQYLRGSAAPKIILKKHLKL